MASAPEGVFTVTPPSFFEILPPTKRITPLEKDATISPVLLVGVVDEFVDDEVRARADGEGRAVDQEHLHEAAAGGVDALVEEDRLADIELGLRRAAQAREGIGIDGGGDADLVGMGGPMRAKAERERASDGRAHSAAETAV